MAKLRVFSGERRPLACSSRQLAANLYSMFLWSCALRNAFGKLPNATGWQPVLPSPAPSSDRLVPGSRRRNYSCRTADVLPLVICCRHRYEKGVWHDHLFAKRAAFIRHSTPVRLGPFVLRHFPRLSSALSARVSFDMQSRGVPTPRRQGAKKRCVKLPDSDLKP